MVGEGAVVVTPIRLHRRGVCGDSDFTVLVVMALSSTAVRIRAGPIETNRSGSAW